MQLFMLILKKTEVLDTLIHELFEAGIKGGTILEGEGMAASLQHMDDIPMFGMLRRAIMSSDRETVRTLLLVLKDDQVQDTINVVKRVVGDMSAPNTGIMFTLPINNVEGFGA